MPTAASAATRLRSRFGLKQSPRVSKLLEAASAGCEPPVPAVRRCVQAYLTAWNAFYAAVAGIAVTLVGLLFVALALNPNLIGDRGQVAGRRRPTTASWSFSFLR
jgi:hypothetical protein